MVTFDRSNFKNSVAGFVFILSVSFFPSVSDLAIFAFERLSSEVTTFPNTMMPQVQKRTTISCFSYTMYAVVIRDIIE